MKPLFGALSLMLALSTPAWAVPAPAHIAEARPMVTPVAQGCGPRAWRGPWGGCRDTPYVGPMPGGGFQ